MRHIQLLLASAGSTLILAGCAFTPAASARHSSPIIHTIDVPLLLSPRSSATTPGEQQRHLPQPRTTQVTVPIKATHQPASPTSTPLPPTPLSATPTAISTPRPIIKVPVPEEHHAPEIPNRLIIPP